MGRNANGLLKSNTDKGELTVGQLGLHPKAICKSRSNTFPQGYENTCQEIRLGL